MRKLVLSEKYQNYHNEAVTSADRRLKGAWEEVCRDDSESVQEFLNNSLGARNRV